MYVVYKVLYEQHNLAEELPLFYTAKIHIGVACFQTLNAKKHLSINTSPQECTFKAKCMLSFKLFSL